MLSKGTQTMQMFFPIDPDDALHASFSENLDIKNFAKNWNSHLCSEALSGYSQELQISPSNLTAQILVVLEIWRFLWFSQKFSKKKTKKNSNVVIGINPVIGILNKLSILLLESLRVLSGDCEFLVWIRLLKTLQYVNFFQVWNSEP